MNHNSTQPKEYILCIDDEAIVLQSLKQELKLDDFFSSVSVEITDNSLQALEIADEIIASGGEIPVILSDQRMPLMNGDVLLSEMHKKLPNSKKILLTGYSDLDAVVNLVNQNALYRYLSKPWDKQDLLLTLREAFRSYRSNRVIVDLNSKVESLTHAMVSALESTNFFYDEETGNHIHRISLFSEMIAKRAGFNSDFIKLIKLYSPLHDIGKVGIQKEILLKPGKLTPEEFEHIKEHVTIGYKIINDKAVDEMAKNIVLYHHEKWAGNGYLHSLQKNDIPIEARIVAIADVFDALISERVYKPAFPFQEALLIIESEKSKSFDPDLVDIFLEEIGSFKELPKVFSGRP